MLPIDLDPRELLDWRRTGKPLALVDCREPWEHELARLGDDVLLPLGAIDEENVSPFIGQRVVIYCHHGIRSRTAAILFRRFGIADAQSLAGGIDRWSVDVDPSIERY